LVVDAVAWQDASASLAVQFMDDEARGRELLARAVIYRVTAGSYLWGIASERFADEVARYRHVADVL
jgi:hypothetical protein